MPFISIIIPTRERCETLKSALKTLCGQSFSDAEFIVSDNVSADDTAAVVAGFNDHRIRYIQTPKRLSMADNYSYALGHARGVYVTILGDDDGLVPGALSVLAQWASGSGSDAISWQEATYYWPSYSISKYRGLLQIPLLNVNWNVSAQEAFTASKWGMLRWNYLPIIYGGLVKLDVMNRIRDRTGEYLISHSPDVYSAFAISSVIKHYIYTEYPFTTFGFSGKSMASAMEASRTYDEADTDILDAFQRENTIAPHPDFPVGELELLKLWSAAMADCLYRAKDTVFEGRLFIPNSMWLYRISQDVNFMREPLRSRMKPIIEKIVRQKGRRWLVHLLLRLSAIKNALEKVGLESDRTVEQAKLNVDAAKFGVTDVCGACELVAKLRPPPTQIPTFSRAGLGKLLGLRRSKRRWTT